MKPTPRNKLVPIVQFTTQVELDCQQVAALNRLVLGSTDLSDDQALNLWQALNPWVMEFQHSTPRDVFASLRFIALAKPATEPEPLYPTDLLNSVGSNIETDSPSCLCA
ncbi:hypothetical protein [Acaryochloris marina]|uniref:Uncharacterized protein n=1 Tax=Acaryochloris marina (strain MBIC 11017) TaxID=329726 RepID=A8ZP65_ACAM1|nr:hypothetical protein [Acaryochloris marina]ABW32801.1 hypothetical protein AM1_E0031 [Acaryochloris marina MBIC11017]